MAAVRSAGKHDGSDGNRSYGRLVASALLTEKCSLTYKRSQNVELSVSKCLFTELLNYS
jgi:hypothetical protein